MNLMSFLKVIKKPDAILIVLALIFLVSPGTVAFAVFNPPLFESLHWVKLLFLSIGITAPMLLSGMAIVTGKIGFETRDDLFGMFLVSAIMSGLGMFMITAAFIFIDRPPTLTEGILAASAYEIIFLTVVCFDDWRERRKLKKAGKQK